MKQKFQSLLEKTDQFSISKLLLSRYIDLEDQQLCSIFPRLLEILNFQGWTGFVSEYRVYYPRLVLEFFQNLQTNENKSKSGVLRRESRLRFLAKLYERR